MGNEWKKRIQCYQKQLGKVPVLSGLSESLYAELCREQQTGSQQIQGEQRTEATLVQEVFAAATSFVLAPMLCSYVLWVLQEAVSSGKKRLYFLARDGYQMYQAAEVFCAKLGISLECKYLYCSRYALRMAEYALHIDAVLDYLCLDGIHVTLETVCHRAGMFSEKEIKQSAEVLGIADCRRRLSYAELKALRKKLGQYEEFKKRLEERGAGAYETAIGYLKQEGMLDGTSYALVDSGWSGSIQQSFLRLLQSAGVEEELQGYYFGLYECPKEADRNMYHTYYFSPECGLPRKASFNNNLFECICTSPEGMTEGYEYRNGGYVPRLSERKNPNAAKVSVHTEYFRRYAASLAERIKKKDSGSEIKEEGSFLYAWNLKDRKVIHKVLEGLLSLFMENPTLEEAKAYGSYVFCDDVIGEENQRLAAPLSKVELKANRLFAQVERKYFRADGKAKGSAWPEASAVLAYGSRKKAGRMLRQLKAVQYARCLRKQRKARCGIKSR